MRENDNPPSRGRRVAIWIAQGFVTLLVLGAVAFAALWFIGSKLPEENTVTVAVLVSAPREEAFRIAASPSEYPMWRPEVTAVQMLEPVEGGIRWREQWDQGPPVELILTNYTQDEELRVRMVDSKNTFSGTWTFNFSDQEGGTRIEITEVGRIPNPVIRLLARKFTPNGAEYYPRLWLTRLAEALGDENPEWIRVEYLTMD